MSTAASEREIVQLVQLVERLQRSPFLDVALFWLMVVWWRLSDGGDDVSQWRLSKF